MPIFMLLIIKESPETTLELLGFGFWVSRVQRSISRNTNGLFALRFAIRCWSRAVLGGEEAEEFCAI